MYNVCFWFIAVLLGLFYFCFYCIKYIDFFEYRLGGGWFEKVYFFYFYEFLIGLLKLFWNSVVYILLYIVGRKLRIDFNIGTFFVGINYGKSSVIVRYL